MGEASVFLSSQILLALDGDEVNVRELTAFLPDPRKLTPVEKAVWIELNSWGN